VRGLRNAPSAQIFNSRIVRNHISQGYPELDHDLVTDPATVFFMVLNFGAVFSQGTETAGASVDGSQFRG
jgi:hypothetical protein